jgi:hypothetical protein
MLIQLVFLKMKSFNFRKRIKRNDFTSVFGGVGRRRVIKDFVNIPMRIKLRFIMAQIRRAHQGRRNKVFGTVTALRIRKAYGRRKSVSHFRRRYE